MRKENWIMRLTKERDKANKRLEKLVAWTESEDFKNIDPDAQQLEIAQTTAMATYVNIMNARLKLVPTKSGE